jgi:hypothetical protein
LLTCSKLQVAKSARNALHLNSLQYARLNLEMTLDKHGISRISTMANTPDMAIN